MSIKPQFETYHYTSEICKLQSQSIVECRLPGSEIGGVLSVQAKAVPTECVCADGEVRYSGKLLLCVVFEDADKKVCRMERGAEFFHKAEGERVSPACFAKTTFAIENITYRREGSGLYLSVIVGATSFVFGSKHLEYLVGGENLCVDKQEQTVCKTVCVSGELDYDDEFEVDYAGDILLHEEKVLVSSVQAGAGEIVIEGELLMQACVLLEDGGVQSYERVLPVKMQIASEEAFEKVNAWAKVLVKSSQISLSVDEEKSKSKIALSCTLSADCFLCAEERLFVAADAFSPIGEIAWKKENDRGMYLTSLKKYSERIEGTAKLSLLDQGEYSLQAATKPSVQMVCKKRENGWETEGILTADILLLGTDGSHKNATLEMPFAFPVSGASDCDEAIAEGIVCSLNVRRKKDGETQADATVKVSLKTFKKVEWEYISGLEIEEKEEECKAAISIFLPCEGESLWQVAKRLKRSPEELLKSNPDLKFPVKEGERIFVYRQLS